MTVQAALAAFYARCHVDRRPTRALWLKVGPLAVPVPHPGRIDEHDLHHVVLDVDNDLAGEAVVSAFELRTGPPTFGIALLCLSGIAVGLLVAARRTVAAWRRGAGCRNCYSVDLDVARGWSVDELRSWCGLRR